MVDKPEAATQSNRAQFNFQAHGYGNGIKEIQCKLDSLTYAPCGNLKIFNNLSEGVHILMARSLDQAGNFSDVISYRWVIDKTKPTINITSHPENPAADRNATFSFTPQDSGSGVKQIECRLDGGAFQTCSNPKSYTNLSIGTHRLFVRARDKANNLSLEAHHSWSIDPAIHLICSDSSSTISDNTPYKVELATSEEYETETTNGTLIIKNRGEIIARNMEGVALPSADGQVTQEILNLGGIVRKDDSIEVYTPCQGSQNKSTRVFFSQLKRYLCQDNNTLNQKNYQLGVSVQNHSANENVDLKVIRYGSNLNLSRYNTSSSEQAINYILCANDFINPDNCTNLDKSYRAYRRGSELHHVPGGSNFTCEDISYSPQSTCPLKTNLPITNRITLVNELVKDAPWERLEQVFLSPNQSLNKNYSLGLDQYDPNFYLELRVTNMNNNKCSKKPLVIKSFSLKKHRARRLYFGITTTYIGYRLLNSTQINQFVQSLKGVGVKRLRLGLRGFYDILGNNTRRWSRDSILDFLEVSNREGIKTELRIHPSIEDYLYEDRVYYRPWHQNGFFSTLDVWGQSPPDLNSTKLTIDTLDHWNSEEITVDNRTYTRLFKNCGHTSSSIRKINIERYKVRLNRWLNALKSRNIDVSLLGVFNEQNWTCFNGDIITHFSSAPQSLDSLQLVDSLSSIERETLSREASQWQNESTSNYARIVKATLEVRDSLGLDDVPVESFPSSLGKRTIERMDAISRTPVPMLGHIHTCAFIDKMKDLHYKGKSVFDHLQAISFNVYPGITPEDDVKARTKEQLKTIVEYIKRCAPNKALSISEFGYHQRFYKSLSDTERQLRNSQKRYDSYRSFIELVQENKDWNIERISLFSWDHFRNPIFMRIKKSSWTYEYPLESAFPEAEIMRYSQ